MAAWWTRVTRLRPLSLLLRAAPPGFARVAGTGTRSRSWTETRAETRALRWAHGSVAPVAAPVAAPRGAEHSRSPDELTGPSFFTIIYWVLCRNNNAHLLQVECKNRYGPMWKSKFGPYMVISVADADLIEQVIRQEGKYPIRFDMKNWTDYRDLRGYAYGPFTENGSKWNQLRSVLNQKMLRPRDMVAYVKPINEVVTDLLARLHMLSASNGGMVNNLANEFYKFAFEGISTVLFEKRLGCLEQSVPEETQVFIDAVRTVFIHSEKMALIPKWIRMILPLWKHYCNAWDVIFSFGMKEIDKKMIKISEMVARGEPLEGEYLTYLLSNGKLTEHEIHGSIAELLMAGIDTTSNTMSWVLYHLSREPHLQERLHQEVEGVCPGNTIPNVQDLAKMSFLKAVIKEILRLYPVVPSNSRLIVEGGTKVGGYVFPKNTLFQLCHYAVSHNPEIFPDPEAFKPERWLRKGTMLAHPPFGSIPFGFGVRACVGRRVAELEMYLTLSRLIKEFEVQWDPSQKDILPKTSTVIIPSESINLKFIARK
nr:sterol 26-hydroxylase, mitochondrial isoform X1 [Petromyzon marinus]